MSNEYGDTVVASGYLVIEANGTSARGEIMTAKLDKVTQRPPYLEGCQVAVKVSIRLPKSVFDAAIAAIDVTVPEELISVPDVRIKVD